MDRASEAAVDGHDPMLDARAIQREYGLDVRAARNIIKQAGGRLIGGRWLVRRSRIIAWENAANDEVRRAHSTPSPINDRRVRRPPTIPEDLEPGWWRESHAENGEAS